MSLANMHLRMGDDETNNILVLDKLETAISIAEDKTCRIIREVEVEINACFKSSNDVVALPVPTAEIIEISYIENTTSNAWSDSSYFGYYLR